MLDEDQEAVKKVWPNAKCRSWAVNEFAVTSEVPTDPVSLASGKYGPISERILGIGQDVEAAWARARLVVENH